MTCNHHDSGRRCNRPANGTPYCTLHAVSPGEAGVGSEPTSGSEFQCEVGSEDAPCVETRPAETPSPDDPDIAEVDDPEGDTAPAPRCQFRCGITKEDGTSCEATPQSHTPFCIFHDPDYQEQRRLNSANGGRAPRKYGPRAPMQLEDIPVDTQSPAGIQSIITAVVALELTGQINPTRSRNILRALSVAARNLHINRPTEDDYYHHIGGVIAQIEECVQAAYENDAPPPKPPKLPVPLPPARARQSGTRTSYASASDYLNRLAAQYLNADD